MAANDVKEGQMLVRCGYCRFFKPHEHTDGITGRCVVIIPEWLEAVLDKLTDVSRFTRTDMGCHLGEDRG
jgi:hypothetical protein